MKKYGFGVDVGGTTVKIGFFETTGKMLDKWEIKTNTDYETKYVQTIDVEADNAENGDSGTTKDGLVTVTVTVKQAQFGDTYTLVLDGNWTASGQLDWEVNTGSTCIGAKLCAKGDKK